MTTTYGNTQLPNGVSIFYREAGPKDASTILFLHGFPSSSHQYRNIIPLLATKYHIIAPDLPGFGYTTIPSSLGYQHTFANMGDSILAFLEIHQIKKTAVYVFDYGAPTAWRIASQRPDMIAAVISQNGNAYDEGLGADFWAPLKQYWDLQAQSEEWHNMRKMIAPAVLNEAEVKREYYSGEPDPEKTVDPAAITLDYTLLSRPGQEEIQLDLFYDYRTNLTAYPDLHEWFRKSRVPLLAIWGKNDIIFVPAGAEAFKRDLPQAEIKLIDAGHFAVESHAEEIAEDMLRFLKGSGI